MEIQQHIDAIKAKHEKLIAENPEITEIEYTVKNIDYEKFESFIDQYNKSDKLTPLKSANVGDDLMFTMFKWHLNTESYIRISFYSEKVEFKTTIEVIKKVA